MTVGKIVVKVKVEEVVVIIVEAAEDFNKNVTLCVNAVCGR